MSGRFLVAMDSPDSAYAACVIDTDANAQSFRRRYRNSEIREVSQGEVRRLLDNYCADASRRSLSGGGQS